MSWIIEYLAYFMSLTLLTFWVVIWIMHLCAHINAKLKLNKRSYTSAASKRKRKFKHLINSVNNSNKKSLTSLQINDNNYDKKVTPNTQPTNSTNSEQQATLDLSCDNNSSNHPKVTATLTKSDSSKEDFKQHRKSNSFSYINLPLPGVSIIKPLVGVDENLHSNLDTFFHMDYPTYELLFCVQEPNDDAILIVENLFKIYPNVDAKLFIGGKRVGVNPKINNMQPAYEAMKYELLLISDSSISMKKDTLLDMVSHMRDDVALVHQMPFVCDGRQGFQSIVEKVYFGTAHARAYLTADLLSINCPTGMSALMKKCLLDEVGGIQAFGKYLAEDYFFAKSFTDRGWKISISSQPAWQNSANSSDTLSTLNSRIQRWVSLRFAMVPQWTLLEPFSECMLLGLLGALSISFLVSLDPFTIFLFHVLLWFLSDYKLLCTIQDGPLTFGTTDFIVAWLVRECTALLIFMKGLSNSKVTWRSRVFKLKWGGYAEEICPIEINDHLMSAGPERPSQTVAVVAGKAPEATNKLLKATQTNSADNETIVENNFNDCLKQQVIQLPILCTEQAFSNDCIKAKEVSSDIRNDLEFNQLASQLSSIQIWYNFYQRCNRNAAEQEKIAAC